MRVLDLNGDLSEERLLLLDQILNHSIQILLNHQQTAYASIIKLRLGCLTELIWIGLQQILQETVNLLLSLAGDLDMHLLTLQWQDLLELSQHLKALNLGRLLKINLDIGFLHGLQDDVWWKLVAILRVDALRADPRSNIELLLL